MENSLRKPESGRLESLGKRAVAYLVLIAVAILAINIIGGILVGLVTTVLTVAAVIAVVLVAIWAFRRL